MGRGLKCDCGASSAIVLRISHHKGVADAIQQLDNKKGMCSGRQDDI